MWPDCNSDHDYVHHAASIAQRMRVLPATCSVTKQEAQQAYDAAPLSYNDTTNSDYMRIKNIFEVRHVGGYQSVEWVQHCGQQQGIGENAAASMGQH